MDESALFLDAIKDTCNALFVIFIGEQHTKKPHECCIQLKYNPHHLSDYVTSKPHDFLSNPLKIFSLDDYDNIH